MQAGPRTSVPITFCWESEGWQPSARWDGPAGAWALEGHQSIAHTGPPAFNNTSMASALVMPLLAAAGKLPLAAAPAARPLPAALAEAEPNSGSDMGAAASDAPARSSGGDWGL